MPIRVKVVIFVHQKSNNHYFFFRAAAEPSVCPGSSSCSKCADFNGDSVFGDCDNSCNMCPLCALFYVKPGCDYCKKGVDGCKKDCKEGMAICDKCTKFC